jgi:hypothetical protein
VQKLISAIQVFRHGASVADPATWKSRQVALNAGLGLVSAAAILASAIGWIPEPVQEETIIQFSEGVVLAVLAIINILGTWATSNKVGIGRKPPMPEPIDAELLDTDDDLQSNAEAYDDEAARRLESAASQGRRAFGLD